MKTLLALLLLIPSLCYSNYNSNLKPFCSYLDKEIYFAIEDVFRWEEKTKELNKVPSNEQDNEYFEKYKLTLDLLRNAFEELEYLSNIKMNNKNTMDRVCL